MNGAWTPERCFTNEGWNSPARNTKIFSHPLYVRIDQSQNRTTGL